MAKLNIPPATFEHELVAGNENAAAKAAEATAGKLLRVPAQNLRQIPGFNVRIETPDYLSHVESIAASIEANGFYPNKPLGGYVAKEEDGQVIYVTDGHSRLRAVLSLIEKGVEIGPIPVIVKPQGQSIEDLTVALVQDNEGRPLSVFEKAIVVARLLSFDVAPAEIARRLDMTERYVSDLTLLASSPPKVRKYVIDGSISPTEAVKQLRADPKKAAEKIAKAVDMAKGAGKAKATGKDVKKANEEAEDKTGTSASAKVTKGKLVENFTFKWKTGDILPAQDIFMVSRFREGDWWNYVDADTKEHVVIEEAIEITVRITTAEKDESGNAVVGEDEVDDTFASGEDESQAHLDKISQPAGEDDDL